MKNPLQFVLGDKWIDHNIPTEEESITTFVKNKIAIAYKHDIVVALLEGVQVQT